MGNIANFADYLNHRNEYQSWAREFDLNPERKKEFFKQNKLSNDDKDLDAINSITENVDYDAYLKELIGAVPAISNFFDKVLVMDTNEQVKNNRLAMLTKLKEKFEKLCDFSKVQA